MKFRLIAAEMLIAGSLAMGNVAAQGTAAPLEFNYGYTTADHVNLYVAQDLNLFEKVGLKAKFFTFPSGAPLLAALKSDSLDVLTAGLGFAFALGQKIPLTMLFWNSNDSMAGLPGSRSVARWRVFSIGTPRHLPRPTSRR